VVVVFAFVFSLSWTSFWVIKKVLKGSLRVSADEEDAGLDISEHGMYGYPEQFIPAPELIGYTAPDPSIAAVTGRTGLAPTATNSTAKEVTA
jgi:Amt family ammonium transporter